MTAPRGERAIEAFKALLGGLAATPQVSRNRTDAVDHWPSICIFEGVIKPDENFETGFAHFELELALECHVKSASADALGADMAELLAQIVEAKKADPTLGGLVDDVIEGDSGPLELDGDEGSPFLAVRTVTYTFTFETLLGQPRS